MSRKLSGALLYFCVEVREMTLSAAIFGQPHQDFILNSVGEISGLLVAAQILEWENGDAFWRRRRAH